MRRILALLILGALAGSVSTSLCLSARLERLYWEKEKLKVQLFETTERLLKVESLWISHREGEIAAVTVELEGTIGAFAKLELQRLISEITADLVGEKIENLNPALVMALLDQRKLAAEDKDYLVNVNWIIFSRETVFNLTASPAPP